MKKITLYPLELNDPQKEELQALGAAPSGDIKKTFGRARVPLPTMGMEGSIAPRNTQMTFLQLSLGHENTGAK